MGKTAQTEYDFILSMGDKLGKYVHEWIAVVGTEVVARGEDAEDVCEKAQKQHPSATPFIMKVPADEVMLL